MATEQLLVRLSMDSRQYNREARQAAAATGTISKQAGAASTATGGLQRQMGGLGSVLRGAVVVGGIAALGRGLFSAAEAAERSNSALAVTEQVIEKTGGAANITAEGVVNLSRRLSSMTGVQDELVQEGANVLLTFKNIRNEMGEGNDVFDRSAELMLDVATVMNSDAKGAAIQLGKALNDPVANMGALSRSGLTFTAQQKDQIKTLAESGRLLEAQTIILDELESQLGGTAAASADATDRISNAFGNIGEAVGAGLLPGLEDLADGLAILAGMSPQVTDLADTIKEIGEVNLSDLFQVGEILQITDFRDAMTEIIETADLTDTELRELASGGIKELQEEFKLTDSRAEILADVIETKLASSLTDAEVGARQALEATGSYEEVLAEAGDTAEETAEQTQDAADAMRDLRKAYLEAADPVFAAQSAMDRLRGAQENLAEAQADGTSTARDIAEAQLDVASAALEAEGALSELADGDLNAGIALIAEALEISDDAARDLLETLGILDGTEVTSTVTTRFRTTGSPAAVAAGSGSFNPSSVGGFRHSGGPGERGVPYVIRPDEEIFVPSGNGQFLLNDQVMNALRGLNGGRSTTNHWNIPIQSSGDANTDAQLVGAVHSVLRRAEAL